MGTTGPLIALAVFVPLLGMLFFVYRLVPWSRPGPWRLIWLMATLSSVLFIVAEAAALSGAPSALAVEHQLPLFGSILAGLTGFVLVYRVGYQLVARSIALALTDALTGLSNRRAFEERLRIALERREQFALAYLDVDGFKQVNDTKGHPAGDALLRSIAAILRRAARRVDTVARVGGDEFAVLLMSADEAAARAVCERILAMARDGGTPSISIGVATERDGRSPASLTEAADSAMYRAKQAGGSRIAFTTSPLVLGSA